MRFFNTAEYDSILLAALRSHGLDDDAARRVIAARWPMDAAGLLAEANGRGLVVTPGEVLDFLCDGCGLASPDELADLLAECGPVQFNPEEADAFFDWCVANARAVPTPNGARLQHPDADKKILAACRRAAAPLN